MFFDSSRFFSEKYSLSVLFSTRTFSINPHVNSSPSSSSIDAYRAPISLSFVFVSLFSFENWREKKDRKLMYVSSPSLSLFLSVSSSPDTITYDRACLSEFASFSLHFSWWVAFGIRNSIFVHVQHYSHPPPSLSCLCAYFLFFLPETPILSVSLLLPSNIESNRKNNEGKEGKESEKRLKIGKFCLSFRVDWRSLFDQLLSLAKSPIDLLILNTLLFSLSVRSTVVWT